ncbi:MAG: Ig-like domain-containing protein, partial [Nitrospirae bacterium]|nr:Ig-like domain-containing protein [Nitrospirota bacterium]
MKNNFSGNPYNNIPRLILAGILFLTAFVFYIHPVSAGQAKYTYDDLGRLYQVVDDAGNVATYSYDAVGNLLSITRSTGGIPAPVITGFSPTSANAGTTLSLNISGTNLQGTTLSSDNPGISFSNVQTSATAITTTMALSQSARTGATTLTVSSSAGSAVATFTVNGVPLTLTSLNPTSGPVTRLVTLTGTGFSATPGLNTVNFNGIAATVYSVTINSLKVAVPAGATTGSVTVTVGTNTSNGLPFTVTPGGSPPTISTLYPNAGSVQGGATVKITGTNFTTGTQVYFGSRVGMSVTIIDSSNLTVVTPASSTTGPADVLVTNVNGDALLQGGFTYLPGPPENIQAVNPAMGGITVPTNVLISVLFSRPVDPVSVSSSTFFMTQGGVSVSGTISYSQGNTVVSFSPTGGLLKNTTYSLSITQGLKSIDGIPLDGPFNGFFTTGGGADTSNPTLSMSPQNGQTGVPYNSYVTLVFNESINPISLTTSTFQVSNNGGLKNGTIIFGAQNTVATFVPASPFFPGTAVAVTIKGTVSDPSGNRIIGNSGAGTDLTANFTTATTKDIFPPVVLQINPKNGASGINTNSSISVIFNKSLNPASVTSSTFQVSSGGTATPGTFIFSSYNTVATYIPSQPLPGLSNMTVTLNGIADLNGNAITTPFVSNFTTASSIDNYQPSVISYSPSYGQGGVPLNAKIKIVFSERINPLSVNGSSFRLNGPTGYVSGAITVSADQFSATYTPSSPLVANSYYSFNITNGVTDLAGNPLFNPFSSYFYTSSVYADTTGPSVIRVSPVNGATNMPLNTNVVVQFNQPVAQTSINAQSVVLSKGGIPIDTGMSLEQGGTVLRIVSANLVSLTANTFFQLTVTPGVTDLAGNPLTSQFTSAFTTGGASDTAGPSVVAYSPAYGASGVSQSPVVSITFNEAINPMSVYVGTVRLTGGGINGNIPGTFNISADLKTVNFTPSILLP